MPGACPAWSPKDRIKDLCNKEQRSEIWLGSPDPSSLGTRLDPACSLWMVRKGPSFCLPLASSPYPGLLISYKPSPFRIAQLLPLHLSPKTQPHWGKTQTPPRP